MYASKPKLEKFMNEIVRKSFAPVALFVYNRLGKTRKTINALIQNSIADETEIYIFSDGGRDQKSWKQVNKLRAYLRTISGFKKTTIIERKSNYGLEPNIIQGATELINLYGLAIILEDDALPGKYFLAFMNNALDYYRENKKVMHITGYCFLDLQDLGETVLWKYPEGFGWATWEDRWDKFKYYESKEEALKGLTLEDMKNIELDGNFKCLNNLDLTPIPWDICWYINIYEHNGLCLTPTKSLIRNTGLYSGTHFSGSRLLGKSFYETKASDINITKMTEDIKNNEEAMARLKNFYANASFEYNFLGRIANKLFNYKQKIKNALYTGIYQKVSTKIKWPPVLLWGNMRRLKPISRVFGLNRGLPIDRYYIENFLSANKKDIRGHVLEIGEPEYTRKFGNKQVTHSDVLHAVPDNPEATLIGNLATGEGVPSQAFDCIILTQTLHVIEDVKAAIANSYRALKTDGVLFVSLPGISQISRYDMDRWGDYWRFTDLSAKKLFGEIFGQQNVSIETFGNVLVACAFLHGLASCELKQKELNYNDPDYQLMITVRAIKKEKR